MPVLGTYFVLAFLEKTLKANLLTGLVWKTSSDICFTAAYAGEEKKRTNKKQADMVLLISSKVGLSNQCPTSKVYDVVPRLRDKSVQLTSLLNN